MFAILINATAARSSGALSILNQFVSHISSNDGNYYILFVDPDYKEIVHGESIKYIRVDTKS